jgi:hypothetical protein
VCRPLARVDEDMGERQLDSCGTSGTHVPTVAAHGQRQELKWILRSHRAERGVRAVGEGRRASCIHLQCHLQRRVRALK